MRHAKFCAPHIKSCLLHMLCQNVNARAGQKCFALSGQKTKSANLGKKQGRQENAIGNKACFADGKGFCDKTKRTMSKEIQKDKGCTDRFGMESDIDRGIKVEKNRFGVESEAVASKRKKQRKKQGKNI